MTPWHMNDRSDAMGVNMGPGAVDFPAVMAELRKINGMIGKSPPSPAPPPRRRCRTDAATAAASRPAASNTVTAFAIRLVSAESLLASMKKTSDGIVESYSSHKQKNLRRGNISQLSWFARVWSLDKYPSARLSNSSCVRLAGIN